jgi:hypothetical protein
MAAVKTVLRCTNNRALIRVTGTAAADTATITLNSDLVGSGDALTSGGTPTANIYAAHSETANQITVVRNSVLVGSFFGAGAFTMPDIVLNDQNTSNIVVTFVGGPGMILLDITKVDGFSPKFESGSFGGGDNIANVGS